MTNESKNPVDCLMFILSDFDKDKVRLREFCTAIVDDMASNNFIIIHKDNLESIVEKSVSKNLKDDKQGFPRGAYFWG